MILYTIIDAFNGQYLIGNGIGVGFNGQDGQYFMVGFGWQCVVGF